MLRADDKAADLAAGTQIDVTFGEQALQPTPDVRNALSDHVLVIPARVPFSYLRGS